MRTRVLLLVAALAAAPSFAEQAAVNFHLDPGAGTGLDKSILLSGATLKIDATVLSFLGPVAPQVEFWGLSAVNRTYLDDGSLFGVGVGARVRLFNDEQGYFFNPGQKNRTGNWWGNLWADAHFVYASGGANGGPGFDVGLGYEFSIVEGLSVGPFGKFMLVSTHQLALFGLSFTIGAPQTTPAEADYDKDGIKGDHDKCVDEAEDHDKFEDHDGCPEKDNDKDGIEDHVDACALHAEDKDGVEDHDGCPEGDADQDGVEDSKDKCPSEKGPAENNGCPDSDKDGDGVVDRLDACVEVKGAAENKGCPDTDEDGDGVVDRLDACKAEKGPAANKGCPYPDTDKDGVADNFDNCRTEAGPVENQGCPAKKKQLVVITANKLEIKEKVYFDTGKATIQKRSNPLLDQMAAVLAEHPEIASLQVEGHTDNTGDADRNRLLSHERAKAVVDYLVRKGVDAARLKPVGFGPDRPTDDNATAKGRENNRRVEFNIVGS